MNNDVQWDRRQGREMRELDCTKHPKDVVAPRLLQTDPRRRWSAFCCNLSLCRALHKRSAKKQYDDSASA